MLLTNQRLDKLAMYRVDLESRGMLKVPQKLVKRLQANLPPPPPPSEDQDDAEEGPSDKPYSQGDVKLSRKSGEFFNTNYTKSTLILSMQRKVYLDHYLALLNISTNRHFPFSFANFSSTRTIRTLPPDRVAAMFPSIPVLSLPKTSVFLCTTLRVLHFLLQVTCRA